MLQNKRVPFYHTYSSTTPRVKTNSLQAKMYVNFSEKALQRREHRAMREHLRAYRSRADAAAVKM